MSGVRLVWAAAMLAACGATSVDDLADGSLTLPEELREVSGIAIAADGRIACLQDEKGVIHLVDPSGRVPIVAHSFGQRGDYEALARVGTDYWVLRSDGHLARVATEATDWRITASARLPAGHEWESLCYDAEADRLLTVTKTGVGASDTERGHRVVWAIDPRTLAVSAEPVVRLSRHALVREAEEKHIELPSHHKAKGNDRPAFDFVCSEMQLVPGRHETLLLDGKSSVLFRLDAAGHLLAARLLDRSVLPQPEGMTFLPDGRLLIATEGRGMAARLVVVPLP